MAIPISNRWRLLLTGLITTLILTLLPILGSAQDVLAQDVLSEDTIQPIHIGETSQGRIRGGLSESWVFRGCGDDAIRIDVTSSTLSPRFTLSTISGEEALIESASDGHEDVTHRVSLLVVRGEGRCAA